MALITDLPAATSLATTDLLVKDTGSATQKIAVSDAYADATHAGLVSTGAQTLGGLKTMTLQNPSVFGENSRYKYVLFGQNGSEALTGSITYDSGNATNVTSGKFTFAEYSPKSTADTSSTGFYEYYQLPAVNVGMAANVGYDILTNKTLQVPQILYTTINSGASKAFTIGNTTRIVWFSNGTNAASRGIHFLNSTTSGSITTTAAFSATGVNVATSTNSLTLTNNSGGVMSITFLVMVGEMSIA